MLSNSSKYAINAVLYLAINSSVDRKKGVKEISEVLHIPTAFLAKLLQIFRYIDGGDKFSICLLGIRSCSEETPCPMHYAVKPFRDEFLQELERHNIEYFADKIKRGEAYLII